MKSKNKLLSIFKFDTILIIVLIIVATSIVIFHINQKERSDVYYAGYINGIEHSKDLLDCIYIQERTVEECIDSGIGTIYLEYLISEIRPKVIK